MVTWTTRASDVSKAVAAADPASVHTLHDAGNKPLTRYILSDKIATWHDVDAIKPASDAQDAAWFAKEDVRRWRSNGPWSCSRP